MLHKRAEKRLKIKEKTFKQRTVSFMQLKKDSLEDLKRIIKQDYGVDLSDEDANSIGFSLLKLSRLVITATN